jgi:hypothetical protein
MGIPIGESIMEAYRQHQDDLGWVRRLIGLPIDKIWINPGGGKPRYKFQLSDQINKFDPNRVVIEWKV